MAPPDKLRWLVLLGVLLDQGFVVTVLDDAALENKLSLAYRLSSLETACVNRAILIANNVILKVRHRPFIGKPSFTSKPSDSRVETNTLSLSSSQVTWVLTLQFVFYFIPI